MIHFFKKAGVFFVAIVAAGCAGTPPANIGVSNGTLSECGTKPNCVSSQAEDEKHTVAPITYEGTKAQAHAALINVLEKWPGTTIIQNHDAYVYAECKSRIFGFVDDVEFLFDPAANQIQVRSASRLGYSDLGVNRKRIEAMRERMAVQVQSP